MASLAFNSVGLKVFNDELAFSTANFYIHLVTAEPAASVAAVSGLDLVTGGNYTAKDLTGKQISAVANGGAKITFSNVTWTALYAGDATPVVGVVIVWKAAGSFADTDIPISYLQMQAPYEPATASPGKDFTFQFSSDGVLSVARG